MRVTVGQAVDAISSTFSFPVGMAFRVELVKALERGPYKARGFTLEPLPRQDVKHRVVCVDF